KRQHEQPPCALRLQLAERGGDRGIPVRHADRDDYPSACEPFTQCIGKLARVSQKRRAGVRPNLSVRMAALARANSQDHSMQREAPQQPRCLDDAGIAQEFGKKTAHRARIRAIRRAEVRDEDTEPFFAVVRVAGFASVCRHRTLVAGNGAGSLAEMPHDVDSASFRLAYSQVKSKTYIGSMRE